MHQPWPDPVVLPYPHRQHPEPQQPKAHKPIETTIEHYRSLDEYEIHTNLAGALQ